jgi:hypothetical protein
MKIRNGKYSAQVSILILAGIFSVCETSAQSYAVITLITDPGVKHTDYLHFDISNGQSTSHDFTFREFSRTGEYPNLNLFQYSDDIDTGQFKLNIILKTATEKNVVDTLTIDSSTHGVEIFIYLSVKDSLSDYIKEIKIVKYVSHPESIKFNFIEKPKIGSKAAFQITSLSDLPLFGYPNNAFFFAALYKEIDSDAWVKHYPLSIDIKFCDTISSPKALLKNEISKSWTPNNKDCSEYKFNEKGNYFFELLYSDRSEPDRLTQGETIIKKQNVFRQIFEFNL